MKTTSKIFAAFAVLAVMAIGTGFAVNVIGAIVNATTGFQYNGTAPSNHVLCGNGTTYVDAPNCGTVASPFYQIVQTGGTSFIQRFFLNFDSNFAPADSNPSTTVHLASTITSNTSGNAATATNANAVGGVALSGLCQTGGTGCPPTIGSVTCNSNGCYRQSTDGFYEMWGVSGSFPTGAAASTVFVTFPHAFTTTANLSFVVSADACAQGPCSTGAKNPISVSGNGDLSVSGFTAVAIGVVPTGGGGTSLVGTIHAHWHAFGQ